jgi:hypothetical protein
LRLVRSAPVEHSDGLGDGGGGHDRDLAEVDPTYRDIWRTKSPDFPHLESMVSGSVRIPIDAIDRDKPNKHGLF